MTVVFPIMFVGTNRYAPAGLATDASRQELADLVNGLNHDPSRESLWVMVGRGVVAVAVPSTGGAAITLPTIRTLSDGTTVYAATIPNGQYGVFTGHPSVVDADGNLCVIEHRTVQFNGQLMGGELIDADIAAAQQRIANGGRCETSPYLVATAAQSSKVGVAVGIGLGVAALAVGWAVFGRKGGR